MEEKVTSPNGAPLGRQQLVPDCPDLSGQSRRRTCRVILDLHVYRRGRIWDPCMESLGLRFHENDILLMIVILGLSRDLMHTSVMGFQHALE